MTVFTLTVARFRTHWILKDGNRRNANLVSKNDIFVYVGAIEDSYRNAIGCCQESSVG